MERISDPNDVATALEEKEREAVLNAHKFRHVETPLMLDGVRVCKDCEEPIEQQRVSAIPTCVRCVGCQTILDFKNKGKAKHV